jgi:hypothetical protein
MSVGNFVKIHMADYLRQLDMDDLIHFENITLKQIMDICESANPTSQELSVLQRLHKYYQGPIPAQFEGKIKPAPKFEEETPPPNC